MAITARTSLNGKKRNATTTLGWSTLLDGIGYIFPIFVIQVDQEALRRSLTLKTLVTNNEKVISPLNVEQAMDVRDAFIKV